MTALLLDICVSREQWKVDVQQIVPHELGEHVRVLRVEEWIRSHMPPRADRPRSLVRWPWTMR